MYVSSDGYDDLYNSDPSTVAVAIPMTQIGPKLWLVEQPDGRGIVCRANNATQARTFPADIRYADAEDIAAGAQQRWFETLCSRYGRLTHEEVALRDVFEGSTWMLSRALSTCGGGHWRLVLRHGISVETLPVTARAGYLHGTYALDERDPSPERLAQRVYGVPVEQLQAAA